MWGELLDLVLPSACAGCGRAGAGWCAACDALLGPPRVARLHAGPRARLRAFAAGPYDGGLRAAVLAFKERGRRDLARPLGVPLARAAEAAARASGAAGPVWLVPAPSRAAAARRRGGDHVEALAAHAAAALTAGGVDATAVPLLRLARGARDSVGLDAPARAANLAGRVRLRRAVTVPRGAAVVLVDDVATTGATIAACSAELARAGVGVAAAAVLASAAPLGRTGGSRRHSVIIACGDRTVAGRPA